MHVRKVDIPNFLYIDIYDYNFGHFYTNNVIVLRNMISMISDGGLLYSSHFIAH